MTELTCLLGHRLCSSAAVLDGTAISIVALLVIIYVALRVPARYRSEHALQEKSTQLAMAVSSANLGLWRWDVVTRSFWASDEFKNIFALPVSPAADYASVVSRIHPDDRGAFDTLVRCDHGVMTVEIRLLVLQNDVRWITATAAAVHSRYRLLSVTGVVLDLTPRRRSEDELRNQRSQLTHLMRLALVGQFSGALAHEVTQPLTSILSNAQTAQNLLAKRTSTLEELPQILQDIIGDDLRAVEVVKRIKALLHRGEADLKPTDVIQLLKDTLSIARSELRERRIATRLHVPLSLPLVLADRVQIQQVVLNLILNAADAMANTPVPNRAIEIVAMHNPPTVTVSIADRGSGVADNRMHEIFEPFYSSKSEGLGLGLAISRSIVAAHGGRLWAVNNPGGGATLNFTLQEFH